MDYNDFIDSVQKDAGLASREISDILSELPDGYDELLGSRAPGPISPNTVHTHTLYKG